MRRNNNIRSTLRIAKIELNTMFYSPVAWIILIIFAVQTGLQYSDLLGEFMRTQSLGTKPGNITARLIGGPTGLVGKMPDHLYLYVPLMTMSLMSRELGSGSIKLLYSSPVSNVQIIGGKYMATIVYSLLLVAIVAVPTVYTMFVIKDPDLTTEERFRKKCEIQDYNPKRFRSMADITGDLSVEGGRFVRVIRSTATGRVAYLRNYNDGYVYPTESEITAAFKTLVDGSSWRSSRDTNSAVATTTARAAAI